MRNYLPVIAILSMCANPAAGAADKITAPEQAPFAAAAQAYDGGRYAEASDGWRALADTGDVRAQVAVAGMYRYGEGRPVDLAAAAHWYKIAAEAGNAIAQLNYAEMLRDGLGIPRNRAAAWRWFDRAARQGNGWAAARRDALGKPDDLR